MKRKRSGTIATAVLTTLCLGSLFESIEVLEDPFVGFAVLDGIDIKEEFHVLHWQQLVNTREIIFPLAPTFSSHSAPAIMASLRNVRTTDNDDDDEIIDVVLSRHKSRLTQKLSAAECCPREVET